MLKTLHLFAGAGGGLLCDLILGHQPIAAVEWDPYACAVLRERRDEGWFPGLQVHEGDVRLFDPSRYAGKVDCIHAGFPCSDIAVCGPGGGTNGSRSGLYREVIRIASTLRPRFIFLENSPVITSRGLGDVLGDLAALGYDAKWVCLSAASIGAHHRRDRWWCLATHSDRQGLTQPIGESTAKAVSEKRNSIGMDHRETINSPWDCDPWPKTEGRVVRVVPGLANRIHALGNGQVPIQAAAAWKILSDGWV